MNQGIQIRPVKSQRGMMDFIKLSWQVNAHDPCWVPPLISDRKKMLSATRNPFFVHNPAAFYLAYREGELVGRVAALINGEHTRRYQDRAGFFGFLEAVEDKAVFEALLDAAGDWLRQHGCETILGPVNPTTNDEMGFLIDGFDSPPFFMLTHNPPYYPELVQALGYRKAIDFYSYWIDPASFVSSGKLERVRHAVLERFPVALRTADMSKFRSELEIVRDIYNDAMSDGWGFVPMTREEFDFMADDFKRIIDPELVLIAEFRGEPVGFLLGLPNYNEVFARIGKGRLFPFGLFKYLWYKRRIEGVRVITLGIKRDYQGFGLGSLFYTEIARRIVDRGYSHAEMSWVMEDNVRMNKAARLLGGRIYKTYRVYQKPL